MRHLVYYLIFVFAIGRILNESTTPRQRLLLLNSSFTNRSDVTRDVCQLNNSCVTSSTNVNAATPQTIKKEVPEKWQYNVADENNETTNVIHSVHESNENGSTDALSFDIDIARIGENRTVSPSNDSKSVVMKYHIQQEENCFCDVTEGSCDLNCCCDQDCLYVNRNVFRECKRSLIPPNEDSTCIIKVLDSPLLCVVKDNLYSRHFYPQHKISPETNQVDKLMRNRQSFGWKIVTPFIDEPNNAEVTEDDYDKEYGLGSPLMIVKERGLQIFYLPKSTLTSRACNERKPVSYLENFQTVCTHRLGLDLVTECESENSIFNLNVYFKNISIITNPALINDSSKLNCVRDCVSIVPYVCNSEDLSTCVTMDHTTTISTRVSSRTPNVVCEHAVTSVHYNFVHNGTEGILAARVFLLLQNVTLKAKTLWAVKFATRYEWFGQNYSYELSGYPGYLSGKPVISGFRVATASLHENRTRYAISMDRRRERWLTVFATDVDGSCSKTRRRNIRFQHNAYAQCSIPVTRVETTEQCEHLQKKIYDVIFGEYTNITNVLISAYGAANTHDPFSWVPLTSDLDFSVDSLNGTCSELITSVKLVILHSTVGEHDKPQQTVIAAKLNGLPSSRNPKTFARLRITFAINFYDVTAPPLRIFAEPPTYEIKLPTDFFYPFFSSGHRFKIINFGFWLSSVLVVKLI